MAVKVGSFAKKSDGTGTQAITGVGFTPKALILWTACQTSAGSWGDGVQFSVGFTTGVSESGSCGIASADNVDTSVTSRTHAAAALSIVQAGETLLAECALSSFDAGGFTLNWTTNDANAYIVHYMALGGPNLTHAKLVPFTSAGTTGNFSVTGVGFQPDCVLLLSGMQNTAGQVAELLWMLGAMTASEAWSQYAYSRDNQGTSDTQTDREDALPITACSQILTTWMQASLVSMDVDGFTLNFTSVALGTRLFFALCLKGGSYDLGKFTSIGTNETQQVTGTGFLPDGVLFLSRSLADSNAAATGVAINLSATDGVNEQATSLFDTESLATTNCGAISVTDKAIYTSGDSAADIASLDSDGFTVDWNPHASPQGFLYFAFAGGPASSIPSNKIINC